MRSMFSNRNFTLYWFGGLISVLGDWMLYVILPFYVYARTGSALAGGIMFTVQIVPQVVLSSIAGVFVDYWDRRRTMIIADLARACLLLLLFVVQSSAWLWLFYLVAFVESCIAQFFGPAKGALLPDIVDEQDMLTANSLEESSVHVARLVGPLVGGMLFTWIGIYGLVFIDAVSFLLSAFLVIGIRVSDPRHSSIEEDTSPTPVVTHAAATAWIRFWRDWLSGVQHVSERRVLLTVFISGGISALGYGILTPLWQVWVDTTLGGGAITLSWLLTTQGIGGLIGGILVTRKASTIEPIVLFEVGLIVMGVLLGVIVNVPWLPLSLSLTTLFGGAWLCMSIGGWTLLQQLAGATYLGRILGAYGTVLALLQLAGLTLGSILSMSVGTTLLLTIAASLFATAGLLPFLFVRASDLQPGSLAS